MALTDTEVKGLLKKSAPKENKTAEEDFKDRLAAEEKKVVTEKTEVTTKDTVEQTETDIGQEEEFVVGPNSDKWQLMSILVDGKSKKNVLDKNGNPKGIVGYKIKALEEGLTYMHSKITPTLLSNPFAIPESEEKTTQKDEVILFTKAEAGRLLADETIECTITGGGIIAILALGKPVAQAEDGDENATELPFRPYLKGTKTSGKLAEQVPIEAIIDVKAVQDPENPRKSNKIQSINKGFERFNPVLEETTKQAERRKAKAESSKVKGVAEGDTTNVKTISPTSANTEKTVDAAKEVTNDNVAQATRVSATSMNNQPTTDVGDNKVNLRETTSESSASTNATSKTVAPKTTNIAKGQANSAKNKAATAAARKRNATRRSQAELYRKAFDSKRS